MPQLSPLNWIFLFMLFWLILFLVTSIIWWYKKTSFSLKSTSNLNSNKTHFWSW